MKEHPLKTRRPFRSKKFPSTGVAILYASIPGRRERTLGIARQLLIPCNLQEKVKTNPKSLVGNKGYRKYLKIDLDSVRIDQDKIDEESRFDGKWVLTTNTNFPAYQVAIKYKELWQVEQVFRDVKSVVDTRAVYHQRDENITGHIFCSFLALVLRTECLGTCGKVFQAVGVAIPPAIREVKV